MQKLSLLTTTPQIVQTAKALTDTFADFGDPIDCRHYDKVGIFTTSDVNDSTGISIKALGFHTLGGDAYEIDGLNEIAIDAADSKKYYEFEVGALLYIQLQAKATVVGATAGTLEIQTIKVGS
jgi:hypothetical protein